jgi:hypothetical protein
MNSGGYFFIFVIVILLCMLPAAISKDKKRAKERKRNAEIKTEREKALENHLLNMKNSKQNHIITNTENSKTLVIDENDKKVFLIQHDKNSIQIAEQTFSYNDLLSISLIEDGETVTDFRRSSQIGGALIGGLVLGGLGAVIGGLSGTTKTSEMVEKITLRLVVNDTKNPLFEIDFLNTQTKKKDLRYQDAMQKARHWHGLIEVLIKRADMEDKENEKNNVVQSSSNSLADELKKLAELRDTGVLSDAEFQKQKEKLLGL